MAKLLVDKIRPVDWVIAGYHLMMAVSAIALRDNITGWRLVAARHGLVSAAVLGMTMGVASQRSRLARLAYYWYPVVTLPLAYSWAGDFVHALFPWRLDAYLHRFDVWLLGTTSAELVNRISLLWFADLMQLSYCSFFLLIAASCLWLYLSGRRAEFEQLTLAIILTLYATYLMFMLLPAHSPRFEYPYSTGGGSVALMIRGWLESAAYCGGAFPSGHAAATLAICLLMWRYVQWRSWPFLVLASLLLLSTLYGGYHYLADVLFGLALGAMAAAGALAWDRRHQRSLGSQSRDLRKGLV